jgi:predicted extracellular nuclease
VTASGSVLTIKPTTSLAYSTGFYVEYDAGIVTDLAGNSLAAGISGNSAWNFITRAESPVIITQYYEGVSNNKFIEIANVGGTSLTLTGYSLVLWSNADAEGWKNTNTYTTTSILNLSTVTLAPGQVYVVANSQSVSPIPATSANAQSTITYFNGNDSVVLHYTGGGLTINDPAKLIWF